jgi:nitrogen fixation/metabolism regulation signal transduction histidine kinase
MKLPGRFEWKVLGAVLLGATLAVGTAAYALQFMVRNLGALSIEHHRQIGGASDRAAEVFRGYFAERKEEFRRRAADIARARPPRMSDLANVDGLMRARLYEGGVKGDEWQAAPEVLARLHEGPPFSSVMSGPPGEPERILELTFGIPVEMYSAFQALQRAQNREQELDRAFEAVVPRFLRQYVLLVTCVLTAASLVGLILARRITRRVLRLQVAARQVGAGDLAVRVQPTGHDELDELGRAFDRMVGELADARSRLEYLQKVSAWQEVARRLAHEIKNPLTPIQLSMQQLDSQYRGDDPAYRKLLATAREIMHEEITGLRRLVEDFSAFAKLPKVEPSAIDLGNLVTEAVRLQPEWTPHVRAEPAGAPVTASVDKLLFRRVIANLVENAMQAARGAGKEPEVRLYVEPRAGGKRAAIIVDDNGPGVPVAERQRIFDPYVTHREGGTGLGLAIVRKIVIDHGGDVVVQDAPGPLGGARFVVEIPAA